MSISPLKPRLYFVPASLRPRAYLGSISPPTPRPSSEGPRDRTCSQRAAVKRRRSRPRKVLHASHPDPRNPLSRKCLGSV